MEYRTNHGSFNYNWGQPEGQQGHQQNNNNQHVPPVNNFNSYQASSDAGTASQMFPPGDCANVLNEFQMVQQLQQVQLEIAARARAFNTREQYPLSNSSFGRDTKPRLVLAGNRNQPFQPVNPVQLQPSMSIPVQNIPQPPAQSFQEVSSEKRKPTQREAPPKRKRGRPRKEVQKKVETESESSNEEEDDSSVDSYFRTERISSRKIKKGRPLAAQKNTLKGTTVITTPTATSKGTGSNDGMPSTNPVISASSEGDKDKAISCILPPPTCTLCKETFTTAFNLTKHMKSLHPDEQEKKRPRPLQPKINPKYRLVPALEALKITPEQEEFLKKIIAQVTCTKCTKKCRSKHKLIKHMQRYHSKDKKSESEGNIGPLEFNCQICSYTFEKKSDLAKHFWLYHYKAKHGWFSTIFYPMRCPFCPKENLFTQINSFKFHISKSHKKETDFSIIGMQMRNTSSRIVGKTDKKSNYCSKCNFVTTNFVGLAEHYATVHVIPDFSFCKICGIFLVDQDSRVEHTLRLHPEVEIEKAGEENLFTDSILLQDGDLQTCDTCDSCFSSTKFLAQHKSEDHPKIMDEVSDFEGIVDKLYCFYCGNVSNSRTKHEKHMKSDHAHLGPMHQYVKEKNIYKCEYCKGYFGHVVKLRQHFYQMHMAQPPINDDRAEQEISKLASELQVELANLIPIYAPKTAAVPASFLPDQNRNQGVISEEDKEQDDDYEDPIIIRGKITRKVTFTCYICSKTFRLGKELDHHQINYHPEKREEFSLICGVCHKKYTTINIRRQHIVRTHLTTKTDNNVPCYLCGESFPTRFDQKKHIMKMHEHQAFIASPERLPRQPAPVHGQPPQEWTCFICKNKFQSQNVLLEHIKNVHPDEFEEGSKRVCGICNLKLSSRNVLQRHIRIQHARIRPRFQCPQCPMIFSRPTNVRSHCKSVHLSISSNKISSDFYEDKPQCKYCGLAFPKEILKRRHIHTDHPEEALAERKKKAMQMTTYERRSKGEFYCKICTFSYSSESNLIQHVVTAHDRDLKLCEFCWIDIDVHKFNRHIIRAHPERYYTLSTWIQNPAIPDRLRQLPLSTVLNLISKVQHEEESAGNVDKSEKLGKRANKSKTPKPKKKPDESSSFSENSSEDSGSDSVDSDSTSEASSSDELKSKGSNDDEGGSGSDSDESLGLGLNFASDDESKHSDKSKEPKPKPALKKGRSNSSLHQSSAKSSGKTRLPKPTRKNTKTSEKLKAKDSNDDEGSSGSDSDESLGLGLNFASDDESKHSDKSKEPKPKPALKKGRSNSSLHQSSAKSSGKTRLPKPTRKNTKTSEKLKAKDSNDDEGSSGSDSDESLGLGLNFASDDESKHSDKNEEPKSMSRKSRLNRNLTQASAKSSGKTKLSKPTRKNTKTSEKLKAKDSNDDEVGSGSDSDESLGLGLNFASDDESKHSDKSKGPKPKPVLKKGRSNSSLHQSSAKSSGKTRLSKPARKNTKTANRRKVGASKNRSKSKSWGLNFSSDESSSESEASVSEQSDSDISEKLQRKPLSRKLSNISAKTPLKMCPKTFNSIVLLTPLPVALTQEKPCKAEKKTSKKRKQKSKSFGLGLNFSSDDSSDNLLKSSEDEDSYNSTEEDKKIILKAGGTKRVLKSRSQDQVKLHVDAKPHNLRKVAPEKSPGKPSISDPKGKPRRLRVTKSRTGKSSAPKKPVTEKPVAKVSMNNSDKGSGSGDDWQNFNVPKIKVEIMEIEEDST